MQKVERYIIVDSNLGGLENCPFFVSFTEQSGKALKSLFFFSYSPVRSFFCIAKYAQTVL